MDNETKIEPSSNSVLETGNSLNDGISVPEENDCLFGRGGGTNHHPGNKKYRILISQHKAQYLKACRQDKPLIAYQIVRFWKSQSGRFLKKDETTEMWHEIDDEKARAKVSQSLREKSKDEKKRKTGALDSWSMSKSDILNTVQLAILSIGYSADDVELTSKESGLDSQALSALATIFRTRYAIELTPEEIANKRIHELTERIYSMILTKRSENFPPLLTPMYPNIDTLAAAANAIKTPPKLDIAKPTIEQGIGEEIKQTLARVTIADEDLKPPAMIAKTNKWQPSEDADLRRLVDTLGIQWTKIADQMTNRNARQCRERWVHHLRPGIKKGSWTAEEDEQIRNLHAKYGNSWHRIASEMEGRSDNAIKNRCHSWRRSNEHEMELTQSDMSSQEEVASMTLLQLRESPLTLPELPYLGPPQTIQVRSCKKKRKVSDDSGISAVESDNQTKKMLLSFDEKPAD